MMPRILAIIGAATFLSIYIVRYWQWFRYLRWKWKAIPHYEQQDRISNGLCWNCGYDVRATPDRCPECGVEVVSPKQ